MSIFEELRLIRWPSEFDVEYANGRRERLLRGEGVSIISPDDDPNGRGALCADLPPKHPRNQKRGGRYIYLDELRAIRSSDGSLLWPA
ncbi:hypothetical protein [Singulisphaera sp. PoT]|uniref:hypothetical protein n=1 Tax=Singulisphaera sp. PoT TaxID=3411797 RepID=UPI003BF568B9